MATEKTSTTRPPLTRQRILDAAIEIADTEGLDALTMRRIGAQLQVKAMSLYKHVANKDEILEELVDHVVAEIELPTPGADWKSAMRGRARSVREVFGRHSWALGLYERTENAGPAVLGNLDATIATLRAAGFSIDNAAHAFWMLDCFVYGQVVMESSMSFGGAGDVETSNVADVAETLGEHFPSLAEMVLHAQQVTYSTENEFELGLDLILDGIERLAQP